MTSVMLLESLKTRTEAATAELLLPVKPTKKEQEPEIRAPDVYKMRLPDEKASITSTVEAFAQKKQLDLAVLVFTSILENGSVVYYGGTRALWAQEAFPDVENEEHSFQDGLLSRKQQILPKLTDIIASYS